MKPKYSHCRFGAALLIPVLVSRSWTQEKNFVQCNKHMHLVVWTNPPQGYWPHWVREACAHDRVVCRRCFQGCCPGSRCTDTIQSLCHRLLQSQNPDTRWSLRIGCSWQRSPQTSICFVSWAPFGGRSLSFCWCKVDLRWCWTAECLPPPSGTRCWTPRWTAGRTPLAFSTVSGEPFELDNPLLGHRT